jgi:type IV pilus assembly protein PilA
MRPLSLPLRRLPRSSGLLARPAFTLIELLIVVVIIGILAAIAVPKFANTKGKANLAAMKSDLRNLSTAEEGWYYDHHTYTLSVDSLQYRSTGGVQISIVSATSTGWSATSTHPQAYPHFCALFIGDAAPIDPATEAGIVACR